MLRWMMAHRYMIWPQEGSEWAICYNRHYPEYMRALALNGADVVVIPQASTVNEWPDGLYEAELRVAHPSRMDTFVP